MQIASKRKSAITHVESMAKWMDSKFTIPGTDIKFGFDALIGLIPGAGDFATLAISGYMITILAKNGASGFVVARMALNIVIDALLGSVPILGDIFDVAFKANIRNMKLMQEHYVEDRHKGGAWKVIVPVLLVLVLVVGTLAWLSYTFFVWVFS
ncbi:DUF4112 domain-containing protein [Persicitalea jodogahamensis]|uniref:DUF4112 domain-containing protein n=1 Tax=Persicitalea jodogahamensis TaxID=402147 RepID=A0A8J3G861_9BACT|nr:DUF4112 domain-containing protein [Persicitalea jodogahamensis]GHB63158.1 hypothetical protein GCM10007390_16240 [Persicitalea jodogahamensis]